MKTIAALIASAAFVNPALAGGQIGLDRFHRLLVAAVFGQHAGLVEIFHADGVMVFAQLLLAQPLGAELPNLAGYTRVVMLFDGQDPDAVDRARAAWKTVKAAGHDATYLQQSERGRWEKKG